MECSDQETFLYLHYANVRQKRPWLLHGQNLCSGPEDLSKAFSKHVGSLEVDLEELVQRGSGIPICIFLCISLTNNSSLVLCTKCLSAAHA